MEEKTTVSVNERLKNVRESTGITQKDVGKRLNMSRTTISSYETGRRLPSIDVLRILADFYKVEIGYLLGESNSAGELNEAAKRKLINFKYLIKDRYLDLSDLSDVSKMELISYYQYLKFKDMKESG